MDAAAERSFREFVAARTPSLWRTAYALTGHQQQAEDLLQSALTKTAARWRWVRNQGNPEAYVRQAMYHEQVSWWRRRGRVDERATGLVPDRAAPDDSADEIGVRLTVRDALLRLAPRQRAVLVLRYLEDQPEAVVAELLGCSVGTVRSQTHRALARLRELCPELSHRNDEPEMTR